ncbi:hypothetical protein [Flavobacterium profundi]|uniref:hypothetical protein n=1 Tax=Flavobacterium profundi TaxID=1774945 RepID=UPI0012FCB0AA|nr:hypothetical protein [Flavobacterium profundi]
MFSKEQRAKSKEQRNFRSKSTFYILFSFFYVLSSQGQCAMCRAALESEESGVQAEAINDGIVYLMVIPYILVAVAGYAIYRMKFAKKKEVTP